MPAAPPLVWEHLESKDPGLTSRVKVPGGWLVRVVFKVGVSVTFMPDPDHAWKALASDKFREVS